MQSGFTCQRCLNSLRTAANIASPSALYKSKPSCRWKSNIRIRSLRPTERPPAGLPAQQQRTIIAPGSQGQYVRNEPPEIPTPPGLERTPIPEVSGRALLQPNNLFHAFSDSPSPEIRRRAAFMKTHAYCPHPSHRQTWLPTAPHDLEAKRDDSLPPAHVRFECPDCGIPVSCSEEHWADDYESHMEICDTLREINEDDHDLRSGRFFPEFEYPGPQIEEILVNMTNWDTYMYTREFRANNDPRSMRQATRLLTYPMTIGSILHELSPYNIRRGGRLTIEGLKSLSGMYFPFPSTLSPHLPLLYKLFATRFTLPALAEVSISKASALTPLPSVFSFLAPAPNPLSHAKSGCN